MGILDTIMRPHPIRYDKRLVLKVADTRDELAACFRLLHDAYVDSGFMRPHESGMRVTVYHALPTTTTLCAKFDGVVVGTLSLIRENPLGFPMQSAFDLSEVGRRQGKVAEVSALAIDRSFREMSVLMPLMSFMYHYCVKFFDTSRLLIAVNPKHIRMYESVFFFERLNACAIESYDFVNGAPAIGASLDLDEAYEKVMHKHAKDETRKEVVECFRRPIANIRLPERRYFTTNDPVMTPELLDHFFNQKTDVFSCLTERQKHLLLGVYGLSEFEAVLPKPISYDEVRTNWKDRFWLRCKGVFNVDKLASSLGLEVFDILDNGFLAISNSISDAVKIGMVGEVFLKIGAQENSRMQVELVGIQAENSMRVLAFKILTSDMPWVKMTTAISRGATRGDIEHATRFLESAHASIYHPVV